MQARTATTTTATAATTSRRGETASQRKKPHSLTLFQAMKVSGPAPERINGRLAMLMFAPMVLREVNASETVLQQFAHPDWRLVLACGLAMYASLVPVLAGCKDEDFGFMSVRAERANGRLAMLAWAAVVALEQQGGVCFF